MGTMEDEEAIYDDAGCVEMKQSVNNMRAMFEKSAAPVIKPKPIAPKPKKLLINQTQQNGAAPQLPEKRLKSPVKKTPPPPPVQIRNSTQGPLLEKRPSSRETIWPPVSDKSPSLSSASSVDISSPVDIKPPVLKPKPTVAAKPKPNQEQTTVPKPVDSGVKVHAFNNEQETNTQPELRSPKSKVYDDNHKVTEAKRITSILTGHNSIVPVASELESRVQHGRKVYLLQPVPKKPALPPNKPEKPEGIDLSIFEVDDDEELYDDIGAYGDIIGRRSVVSEIKTFDSEEEDEDEIYDDVGAHRDDDNGEDINAEDDDVYEIM